MATKWDYSKIKNFPEGGTIQKCGQHLYVIKRSSRYSPSKGRSEDASRKTVGQVVDNVFYTSTEYKQKFQKGIKPRRVPVIAPPSEVPPAFKLLSDKQFAQMMLAECKEVNVGILPILHKTAERMHILQDLQSVFGKPMSDLAFSIVAYFIETENNVARHFGDWVQNRHLPISANMTDRDLSKIFAQFGQNRDLVQKFLSCRVARNMNAPMLLSVDSTTLDWESSSSEKAKVGKHKKGDYGSQLGYMVTFNTSTHEPLFYRVLPGNLHDSQTVLDLVCRFNEYGLQREDCIAVLDRGYISDENLLNCSENRMRCIFAKTIVKNDWIQNSIIDKAKQDFIDAKHHVIDSERMLLDGRVQAATYQRRRKIEGQNVTVYVHVYRSSRALADENEAFMQQLRKFEELWQSRAGMTKTLQRDPLMQYFTIEDDRLVRDSVEIKKHAADFGFFVNVSTFKCTAQECYDYYRYRSGVERVFRSGKSDVNMNVLRTHSDETAEGKAFLAFLELMILEEIKQNLARTQYKAIKSGKPHAEIGAHTYDFDEVLSGLSSVSYTQRRSTGTLFCREVTDKQHKMAIACGCRGIYEQAYSY